MKWIILAAAAFVLPACAAFQAPHPMTVANAVERVGGNRPPFMAAIENNVRSGESPQKVFQAFDADRASNGIWKRRMVGTRSTGAGKEAVYVYFWVPAAEAADRAPVPVFRLVFLDGKLLDLETVGAPQAIG
jgi:hypothetical protein